MRDALGAYDNAVAMAREDPTAAAGLYRQAASGFQALVDADLRNAGLEYNLGNAYFRLGRLGRAILHYRRAARMEPSRPELTANLRYARDRVEPRIDSSGERRLRRRVLFWHYNTSLSQRFRALAVLSIIGWAQLFVWLLWSKRPLLVAGLFAVALALALGGSILWQQSDEARHPPAVIVGDEVYLRLGRGKGTDLALRQALGPGVELRILAQRGDWTEVRLANGQTGWLPATAIERIVEPLAE